jgi:hypothetical protein
VKNDYISEYEARAVSGLEEPLKEIRVLILRLINLAADEI